MARIAGINIPLNKRVEIGLTYIYGIGHSQARKIVEEAKVDPNTLVKDLTDDEIVRLRETIDDKLQVEGDLRRERSQDVKRLQEIGAYRRHQHSAQQAGRGRSHLHLRDRSVARPRHAGQDRRQPRHLRQGPHR